MSYEQDKITYSRIQHVNIEWYCPRCTSIQVIDAGHIKQDEIIEICCDECDLKFEYKIKTKLLYKFCT